MTSDRAIEADRRNAKASTGPRTMAGKARTGQNARKHGLGAKQAASDAALEAECFAALIAGDLGTDPAIPSARIGRSASLFPRSAGRTISRRRRSLCCEPLQPVRSRRPKWRHLPSWLRYTSGRSDWLKPLKSASDGSSLHPVKQFRP